MKKSIAIAATALFAVMGLAACSDQPATEEEPVEVVEEVNDGDGTVEEVEEGEVEVEE